MSPSPPHTRMQAGFFIAFEGPEGAGKSTQIERLGHRLAGAGIDTVRTREPGGTPAGDRIRAVILDPDLEVAPTTEFLLYSASRAQLVHDVIRPALEAGRTVLSDRFAGASLAYQGYGRGLDRAFIRSLSDRVTQGVEPDLTLLLDVNVTMGLERVAKRGMQDRLERAEEDFHQRVRAGFLEIAADRPTWHVIDAAAPEVEVADRIWQLVASRHPSLDDAATVARDVRSRDADPLPGPHEDDAGIAAPGPKEDS